MAKLCQIWDSNGFQRVYRGHSSWNVMIAFGQSFAIYNHCMRQILFKHRKKIPKTRMGQYNHTYSRIGPQACFFNDFGYFCKFLEKLDRFLADFYKSRKGWSVAMGQQQSDKSKKTSKIGFLCSKHPVKPLWVRPKGICFKIS